MKRLLLVLWMAIQITAPKHLYSEDGLISMNFENADLRLVIKFVSEATGENFVIDEGVQGQITVMGSTKIAAAQLRQVLESVLAVSGYVLVNAGEVTKVVPMESARQISAETTGEGLLKQASFITNIVRLKFASAEKISTIMTPFLTRAGHISFYAPTNTIIISDRRENMEHLVDMVNDLDQKARGRKSRVHVYRLKYAAAEEVSVVLEKLFEKEQKSISTRDAGDSNAAPSVVADEKTNSLVIHANSEMYRSLKKAIRKLDIPRKQILVEVLVTEVNLDDVGKLGIEWATIEGAIYGSAEGFGQDRVNRAEDIAHNVLTGGKFPGTTAGFVHDVVRVGMLEIPRLGILVNAFRNDSNINILSTPQILTTDHTEAEILVGENRAFIKNIQVTPEGGVVRTFEFKDIGLSLVLKPHISEGGKVRLEVHQKVEDVIGQSFEGAVETSKREARTMISVKDSQTAVIGGLIRQRKEKVVKKVPILGDIPFLGVPFKRYEDRTSKTNLLIFICPHIIESNDELSSVTQKKRKESGAEISQEGDFQVRVAQEDASLAAVVKEGNSQNDQSAK